MTNFFLDNPDILFLFDHLDLPRVARLAESGFSHAARYDFAPRDPQEAVGNYRGILETIGALAAETIAPTAEETDRIGNRLNDDGTVTLAPGVEAAISRLGKADLMGLTLPYVYGGLNCPRTVYAMAIDILSRADASVVNFFGLQGVGETIAAFASDDLRRRYLPALAAGRMTGAMVLTEPDAGSDLQSVKTRAEMDEKGVWRLNGVKRFITNGCGDVLLVLARSEPGTADGRGLSLFLAERGPRVKVRRLEEKLGIHGSPTCELVLDDAPAEIIGERGRGLTACVAPLMDAARLGIAAQSVGIAEAAYRVARDFARRRRQFGGAIDEIPAVRELLVDMSVDIQAARALVYYTGFCADLEKGSSEAPGGVSGGSEEAALKSEARRYGRYRDMLVPAAKYFASEMSMRVANNAVAVLGGSGYMRDYAVERHLRDSRITTIYEGTTQIQVSAAMRPLAGGAAAAMIDDLLGGSWSEDVSGLAEALREGRSLFDEALSFAANRPDRDYADIHARRIVDMALHLIAGALLARQAAADRSKNAVARRWIASKLHEARTLRDIVTSGDRSVVEDFDALAGRNPSFA